MKADLVGRRNWLIGASGAVLAVPFLRSLWPENARAQPSRNVRFVFVGGRYGMSFDHYYPSEEASEASDGVHHRPLSSITAASGHISPILSSEWDDLRSKVSILRGLDGMEIAGDGHSGTVPLTGSGLVSDSPSFPESADVVLEHSSRFYPSIPYTRALRVSPAEELGYTPIFSYTSRNGAVESIVPDTLPHDVYTKLFAPSTRMRRRERGVRQAPVVNGVMENVRRVMASSRVSADDRYKLEAHLSLLSDVERSLGVSAPECTSAIEPAEMLETSDALHEAAMNLEVAALACGMTKLVVHGIVQHDSEPTPNEGEAHSAAHGGRSSSAESGRAEVDQWTMNEWSMRIVARFIKKLDAVADEDGTLLDNTFFLYGNVEARGFHTFYDMPVIVAGMPDKLRLGEYIDYRPRPLRFADEARDLYAGRPYNNLLVTMFKALGLEPDDYQRFGRAGFGVYDGFDARLADHYAPLVRGVNDALPFVYRG